MHLLRKQTIRKSKKRTQNSRGREEREGSLILGERKRQKKNINVRYKLYMDLCIVIIDCNEDCNMGKLGRLKANPRP